MRLMRKEDIHQVSEISQEAFPTIWPPTNYKHELENRLAHYIVACDEEEITEEPVMIAPLEENVSRLTYKVRRLFNNSRFFNRESSRLVNQRIIGFTGFWIMAGEAHIISIAVRSSNHGQGVGGMLLISAIDLATELNAQIITLEVRVSNIVAQSLYQKYGFVQMGLRRNYYTDDREDALIMTIEDITAAVFRERFQQLKQSHSKKWGIALYHIVR